MSLRTVLQLVVHGEATSRADIARRTGLARSTVSQQVELLIGSGLVEEVVTSASVRGRPPRLLRVRAAAGLLVAVDVDVPATRVAVADLAGNTLAVGVVDRPVDDGPEAVLAGVVDQVRRSVAGLDAPLLQVVVGLPGPVDFVHGYAVRPPIMPGWDGHPVGERLRAALGVPVLVDNDVNLMAVGEADVAGVDPPLLFVRIGAGIGSGLVTGPFQVHRGADGAAGDIGHVRTSARSEVLCRCGKTGCLEATASLRAIAADLGIPEVRGADREHGQRTLAARVAAGDPVAVHRIRQAAAEIGDVVAGLVHFFNPRTLVLGGALSSLRDEVLAGVRASVYENALPLATRKLVITTSQLDGEAVLRGAVALAVQEVFSPDGLSGLLARGGGRVSPGS
jgi:predicted NBD/HSP70 family sugar kinase